MPRPREILLDAYLSAGSARLANAALWALARPPKSGAVDGPTRSMARHDLCLAGMSSHADYEPRERGTDLLYVARQQINMPSFDFD